MGQLEHPASARSHAAALRSANGFENAILLKGPLTCITDGQRIDLSTFGGPVLSRGGSGDILTGLVGGLLAQGHNTFEAAKLAAVWHGQAADHLAQTVDILPSQPHNCLTTYTNRYAPKHHSN